MGKFIGSTKAILAGIAVWVSFPGGAIPLTASTFQVLHGFSLPPTWPDSALIRDSAGNLYGTASEGGDFNDGAIFKIDTSNAVTILHSFNGIDGAYPACSLIMDSAGNLYGTTLLGGSSNDGTIFRLDPSNTLTTLHSFTGADGSNPQAGLIQDSSGNLYGTAGTVFKLDTANTLTTTVPAGGSYAALVMDSSGNLYGTTYRGGTPSGNCFSGCGTIFKVDASFVPTTLYSFTGGNDGGYPFASLIIDGSGNLYGTAYAGGAGICIGGCGTIFKFDTSNTLTTLYSFDGGPIYPRSSLLMDSSGNLYGTTMAGGSDGGAVYKLDTFNTLTMLSTVPETYAAVIMDPAGNIFGTSHAGGNQACIGGCGIVFKLDTSNTLTTLYAFTSSGGISPRSALVRDGAGNMYGTSYLGGDFGGGTVFRLDPLNSLTTLHSFNGADGDGLVSSLVIDSSGNLYGTNWFGGAGLSGTVFKLDASNSLTTLHAFSGPDGGGPNGALLMDSQGNLVGTTVSGGSSNNGTIFRLDTSGILTTLHSFTGTDGAYPSAGLISDSVGNFYGTTAQGGQGCGSYGCGTIFEFDTSNVLTTLHSFSGSDGSDPQASVIKDPSGNFFGTTAGYGPVPEVFKLDVLGTLTTLDSLSSPSYASLVRDSSGSLYGTTLGTPTAPCSANCGTVFRIDAANRLTTLYSFTGGVDGANPYGALTIDASGNLFGTVSAGRGSSAGGAIFKIALDPCPAVNVAPSNLPPGAVSIAYSQSIAASGGSGPYVYLVSAGSLPAGLSLDSSTGVISGTPIQAGSSSFTVSAVDLNGCQGSQGYTLTINAAAVRFFTITPCRLIDTRRPAGTYGGPALQGSGAQRNFLVDGQCGIPAGVVAVSANVTVVGASGRGDLRMFSTGTPTPTASMINFNAGQTRAGNAILPMVGNPVGSITVQCDIPSGTTNMLLDVNGYFQ